MNGTVPTIITLVGALTCGSQNADVARQSEHAQF